MTKSGILKLTIAVLSLLFMASCTKDDKVAKLTFEVKDAESVAISDAMITINSKELTTDAQGMASIELDEGSYNYTVKKEGFVNYSGNITMNKNDFTEKVTLSVEIENNAGELVFRVVNTENTPILGALISINNQEQATDNQGVAKFELEEGTYTYTITKGSFFDYSGTVTMTVEGFTEEVVLESSLMEGTFELNVSDRKKWYYFSFKDGLVGEGSAKPTDGDDAAWKEKDNWDLAFHNTNVRTNSGLSGNGQGGAFEMESNIMTEVTTAPGNDYITDTEIRIFLNMPPTNPAEDIKNVGGNTVLDLWADFAHETGTWTIKDKVFVIKTADGKYAKIQFVNYLDENDHGGLMKFNYVYQADGSMNF